MLKLDWAEPGDPPCYDYDSVRAKPLAKPILYGSLTRELELALIRRYHEEGYLEALEWLVEAHRPMVVPSTDGEAMGHPSPRWSSMGCLACVSPQSHPDRATQRRVSS